MAKCTSATAAAAGQKGGQATVKRHGTKHMVAIGKLGFTATVNKYWRGDRERFLKYLQAKGLAVIDPFPTNGAWQRPIPTPDGP